MSLLVAYILLSSSKNMCPNLISHLFILIARENPELHHPVNCLGNTHRYCQFMFTYLSVLNGTF